MVRHGARQVVDDLFFEYARLLDGLQPKVFIAENVKGLVRGHAKGYFLLILARLRACGYRVEVRVVNAAWLGVPQLRERLIFIGVRDDLCSDLGIAPAFPLPLPYRYTVREALAGLAEPVAPEQWMSGYRIGTEWRKLNRAADPIAI